MDFNNSTLKNIVTMLCQHLRLSGMHNITEIHMISHSTFERYLDRLWDGHGCFSSRKCQRYRSGICAKCYTLRHTRMAVTTNNYGPIIYCNIVKDLVDNVGHRVINTFGITCSDQPKLIHKGHQTGCIGLSLDIPNGCSVTARLICSIDTWRQ